MSIRTLVAAAALALVLPAGSALAGGAVESASEVKIRDSFPAFHGRVLAEHPACAAKRTVKLFKQRRGGDKKLLGTDMTNSRGKWEVLVDPLKSGSYFAVVKRGLAAHDGIAYECRRAKSRTIAVD